VYADLDGAGAVQSRYLHSPAVSVLLGRLDADGQSTWHLPDRLGSTRALTWIGATSAQVLDRIDYDAFGTATENAPTAGDRSKFSGRDYAVRVGGACQWKRCGEPLRERDSPGLDWPTCCHRAVAGVHCGTGLVPDSPLGTAFFRSFLRSTAKPCKGSPRV
jgi:hypothetical protein